jgi:hypothetical protein
MADTKRWGHGTLWAEDEVQFVRDNYESMTPTEISRELGRARMSVYHKIAAIKAEVPVEVPPVKPTGQYVEILHSYVAEDFELREIWARWNGYSAVQVLKRDAHMMCTLLCTAK